MVLKDAGSNWQTLGLKNEANAGILKPAFLLITWWRLHLLLRKSYSIEFYDNMALYFMSSVNIDLMSKWPQSLDQILNRA